MNSDATPALHAHASHWRLLKAFTLSTLVLVVLPSLLTWGVYSLGLWLHGLDLNWFQTMLWWAYALAAVGLGGLGWVLVLGMWWMVVADCFQFLGLGRPVLTLDDAGITYRTRKVSLGPVLWQDICRASYQAEGHLESGAHIEFGLPANHPCGLGASKDWCYIRVHLLATSVDDIWQVLGQRLPAAEL